MNLKIFKTTCKSTEKIFVIILSISLFLLLFSTIFTTTPIPVTIVTYTILVFTLYLLFYIAYIDFKTMEIDNWVSLSLLLFLLAINLLLHFFLAPEVGLVVSEKFSYIPYHNFYTALVLGLPFFLTVLISKEKALGSGDIRIALISGFLIGSNNIRTWLYITVFCALTYGLILGYKKKKFKGLKIPFAPFMILGTVVSLLMDIYF